MSLSLPRHQRAHGRAELVFGPSPRGPVLRHLFHAAPLRVLFPTPEPDDLPQAALVNVGGGLAGGDVLEVSARVEAGTGTTITTPAAEKIYRSLGDASRITTELEVGAGARLEWVPQETILFDGARLERRMTVRLAPDGRLLATEMLVFGRVAGGERFRQGALLDSWRIWRGERLHWVDTTDLSGNVAERMTSPFGFAGAEAMGLMLLAAGEAEAAAARDLLRQAGHDTTLARPGLMLARFLGPAVMVRDAIAVNLPILRSKILNLPPELPRLWTS